MKRYYFLIILLFLAAFSGCSDTAEIDTSATVNDDLTPYDISEENIEPESEFPPKHSFSSMMVSGLVPSDAIAFGDTMALYGWEPAVTCMGNYCDIATTDHMDKPATIVFLSGHGYVGQQAGYFHYSALEEDKHIHVDRSNNKTESYRYGDEPVWTESGDYSDMVESHQAQGYTDWIVLMACNQLSLATRESIIDAMKTPSERPIKGVFSYSGLSGGYVDDLIATKFAELCMNSGGQGSVGYAWLAANQAYAPPFWRQEPGRRFARVIRIALLPLIPLMSKMRKMISGFGN